jgi:hypothetical protein
MIRLHRGKFFRAPAPIANGGLPTRAGPPASRFVNFSRWLPTLACATTLALAPARAAVLIHEYSLRGSFADSAGNTPLTAFGGQISALGYTFAANQGLILASPTISPVNYSLEFSFRLDSVAGGQKLVDFKSLDTNDGLYVRDGRIGFFAASAPGPVIIPDARQRHESGQRLRQRAVRVFVHRQQLARHRHRAQRHVPFLHG